MLKMSSKQFHEFNNFFYISMIIIAALSVNNPKIINLLSFSMIGSGINSILCSYYNLSKITSFKIGKFVLAISGFFIAFAGSLWLLFEIYTICSEIL